MKNYLLKLFKGQKVERYETRSIRRFYNHIRTIKWQDGIIKVYLRVSEGKHPELHGRLTTYYNDATCYNPKELLETFNAFLGG